MSYHQFQDQTGEPYGSFETFFYHDSLGKDRPYRLGERGWYWHACQPGCLPEGDLSGPFDSEQEAIIDATDFI